MKLHNRVRWLAAIGLSTVLLAAAPAQAATQDASAGQQVVGGKTVLTTTPGVVDALTGAGVAVAIAPKLDSRVTTPGGRTVVRNAFRITGGRLDLSKGSGRIAHAGRITFSRHGAAVTVSSFEVSLGAHPRLTALVNGGDRVPVFNLDLSMAGVGSNADVVRLTDVSAHLTSVAADALNATLGTTVFAAGLTFGSVRSIVVVAD